MKEKIKNVAIIGLAATTVAMTAEKLRDKNDNDLSNILSGIKNGDHTLSLGQGGMPSVELFNNIYTVDTVEAATEEKPKWVVIGFPEKADNVEVASGNFVNKAGGGSEMLLAEPGKLLVHRGEIDDKKVQEAGGAIAYIDPTNQQVFEGEEAFFNLPEGGMVYASAAKMTVEFDGKMVELTGPGDHIWLLYVRGKYADETSPEDRNVTMHFTNYRPGHIQAMRYPGVPNGGFISEEQADQQAGLAQEGGTNCGSTGCPKVSRFLADINTGAYVVQELNEQGKWETVDSNWVNIDQN
ncbi:MAG: hypothetical protein KatS3mg089_0931 [Patescibacteria group bacterium]|nr:MAG: hypothetical protein KatS3mg089_0931 [Patescibacteria group bacterium]